MTTLHDLYAIKEQYEIIRKALEQYANPDNWQEQIEGDPFFGSPGGDENKNVFAPSIPAIKNGYELAQNALESADKLISGLWRHNT